MTEEMQITIICTETQKARDFSQTQQIHVLMVSEGFSMSLTELLILVCDFHLNGHRCCVVVERRPAGVQTFILEDHSRLVYLNCGAVTPEAQKTYS